MTGRAALTIAVAIIVAVVVVAAAQAPRLPECPRATPSKVENFHAVYSSQLLAQSALNAWRANPANRAYCVLDDDLEPIWRPFKVAGVLGFEALYSVNITYARP